MGGSSNRVARPLTMVARRGGQHLRLVHPESAQGPSRVGDLAARALPLDPNLRCSIVQELFEADPSLRSVLLAGDPPRLLNRTTFFQALSGRLGFGWPLLWSRSVSTIDLPSAPVVHADEALESTALLLAGTAGVSTLDDVMVVFDDGSIGTLNTAELFLAVARRAVTALAEITAAERRFRALVERSADAVVVCDRSGAPQYVGPSATAVFGLQHLASPMDHIHPDDVGAIEEAFERCLAAGQARGTGRFRDAEGRYRDIEFDARDLTSDPDVAGVVVNFRNVSDRADLERRLRHAAEHDVLTGLVTRQTILAACGAWLRSGRECSLAFVDVDRFKQVNDDVGHEGGDRLLVELATRIQSTAGPEAVVARWGGDEFVVALPTDLSLAREVGQAVVEIARRPLAVRDESIQVSVSVGVAGGDLAADATERIRLADAAMYAAKRGGGDRVIVWQPALHDAGLRRALAADLAESIERGEVTIEMQPIIALADRQIRGVEALARWTHPVRGSVPPSEFIPLAEEQHLIVPLGAQLLRMGCAGVRRWIDAGHAVPFVDINVSPVQIRETDIAEDLERVLVELDIPADRICIEITESALIADFDAARRTLERIRRLGARVALDDFGVGYSSLGYLSELPIDVIKVDRVFVSRLHRSPMDEVLMRGVVQLAHSLDLLVVAEGVETIEQLRIVERVGADLVQGFLFCPPLPIAALDLDLSEAGASGRRP